MLRLISIRCAQWTSGKWPRRPSSWFRSNTFRSSVFSALKRASSKRRIKMDRIFIDEETGEDLIHPLVDCNIRDHPIKSTTVNNAETGEPEVSLLEHSTVKSHLRRVPFQVTSPTARYFGFTLKYGNRFWGRNFFLKTGAWRAKNVRVNSTTLEIVYIFQTIEMWNFSRLRS